MGVIPGTMKLAPGGMEGETKQMMENIGRALKSCGRDFDHVFKCTVMMADMSQWGAFNKIYLEYFKSDRLPTRSAFGASALALGGAIEMEVWASAT
jgi:enamine deaminase RidA (YjgF/YER057c/UK114 family)